MTLVSVPGYGAGDLSVAGNFAAYFDRFFLSGHMWRETWDPEGLLSTLPAISTALLGALVGGLLRSGRNSAAIAAWMFVSLLPILQLLTQNRYVYPAMAPFGLLMSYYLFALRDTRAFGRFTRVLFVALVFYFAVFPIAGVWVKNDTIRKHHGFQERAHEAK